MAPQEANVSGLLRVIFDRPSAALQVSRFRFAQEADLQPGVSRLRVCARGCPGRPATLDKTRTWQGSGTFGASAPKEGTEGATTKPMEMLNPHCGIVRDG